MELDISLCEEIQKNMPFRVRGVRDGIRFCFPTMQETDVQKQGAYVCAVVEEKMKTLAPLFAHGYVVELAGVRLGELERLRLEQALSTYVQKEILVRICSDEKKQIPDTARLYVGTVRGGMLVQAQGDLTVVGDVHAGARLEAGGSITVLGKLLGTAWAGMYEDATAFVCAWQLSPAEIRIAEVRAQKPGMRYTSGLYPELAYLQDGEICIRKYNQNEVYKDRI